MTVRAYGFVILASLGCTNAPSDDPNHWRVDTSVEYEISVAPVDWVVPSEQLPPAFELYASNNNVDIEFFRGRLYLGWRSAPTHFASTEAKMYVMSSGDMGETWVYEAEVSLDSDVREPRFFPAEGQLHLLFFQGGTNPAAFEPQRMWTISKDKQEWSAPQIYWDAPIVPWDIKPRNGSLWMTSYAGEHYSGAENPEIELYFERSEDGFNWEAAGGTRAVYVGGVSEAAFEFDEEGDLWAVTRNEDGDTSGFGSHVCFAASQSLGEWTCSEPSDPERYDSPELFRHGKELYMVARRDIDGPFGDDGSLLNYSLRPKTTALYRIDRETRQVVHLFDLPGAGDTAFPSIRRMDAHTFLLANYTSPLEDPDRTWIDGQTSEEGTQIYLTQLQFLPQ